MHNLFNNMVVSGNYLLIVWISEGKKFPRRVKNQLIIEAKFDGEILTSNPVDHSNSPDFSIELAWALDRKRLHLHRLQRTPVKLQVFALDTVTKAKEVIGYIVLDVRQAQVEKQDSKWYPLLNPKYRNPKPELLVALSLEEDKPLPQLVPTTFTSAADNEDEKLIPSVTKEPSLSTSSSSSLSPAVLQPILNEAEGFYQIGPIEHCKEDFILSVTIAFAANLEQLIQPSSVAFSSLKDDFFFYYTLLGNDVTNEKFKNLAIPEFPVERSSVKIKSSLDHLRTFFAKQPGLEIHLCCGNVSLGSAEVPLTDLVKKNSTEIYMKPLTIEGAFEIKAPIHAQNYLDTSLQDKAILGVAVILRKTDTMITVSQSTENIDGTLSDGLKKATTIPSSQKAEKVSGKYNREVNLGLDSDRKKGAGDQPFSRPNSPEEIDLLSSLEMDKQNLPPEVNDQDKSSLLVSPKFLRKRKTVKSPPHSLPGFEADSGSEKLIPEPSQETAKVACENLTLPTGTNHYCCTVDLGRFRNLLVNYPINCILRYCYPFFGNSSPILTYPPTEVPKNSEINLPQSFCAFNFASLPEQLSDAFKSLPLNIELWHRDKSGKDCLLGIASINLHNVLTKDKTQFTNKNGTKGFRQMFHDCAPVIDVNTNQGQIASLYFVVGLDDLGPVQPRHLLEIPLNTTSSKQEKIQATALSSMEKSEPQVTLGPRDSLEYRTALELELWKATQQELFQKKLKEKEQQYLKMLAEEWKRRDTEREVLYQTRSKEYQELEDKLRDALADIEKREKQLCVNELEVAHLREDIQRQHDNSVQELQETLRRMQEECRHQIDLEHLRVTEIEEQKCRLQNQLVDMEEKLQAKDKEFEKFKQQLHTKPEVRLQSEINVLTLEKAELEKKLEAVSRSRLNYKQQWMRALKELDHRKQKEQTEARIRLKKQEEELEQMRLRYLAAEEKEVTKNERNTLDDIKKELNRFKEQCTAETKFTKAPFNMADKDSPPTRLAPIRDDILEVDLNNYITRLQEEQEALLRTGVYSSSDRIIIELERQIRDAVSKKETVVS